MLFVGVDIGGTFTDVVVFDEKDAAHPKITKVPTITQSPEKAVVEFLRNYRRSADQVSLITHATTVGTNALLTHAGLSKTALITNHGFKDVIEIARQRRPEIYNLKTERPKPLVGRKDRFTIRGRILSDGSVSEPIHRREIRDIGKKLSQSKFDAVSIALLNSYKNPKHEVEAGRLLIEAGFNGQVDLSSHIDPSYREYERTSTTVVNSALSKPVSTYLARLENGIRRAGFPSPIYVMNSDGTTSTIAHASRRPISIIESGPAAGVLACKALAKILRLQNVITFDMGGTTAKAGTIINGQPDLAYEFEAAARVYHGRSIKGSGYPVRQPFIDLAEVSAGGGTIAWLDETGNLKVGPESAGADPGPAAYGKGSKRPTVTDANIVLGRINPRKILGENLRLHHDLAVRAIRTISGKLGTSIDRTAENIVRIVNDNMSKALRIVTVERGRDPRESTLIAFGGAGPLHAYELAEELEIRRIIVPTHPGLFSAFGLLTADLSRTFSEPILKPVTSSIESYFARARRHARESLGQEGFAHYKMVEELDLRYQGQAYDLSVPYRKGLDLVIQFGKEHKRLYGYSSKDPVEAVNARVRAIIHTPKASLAKSELRVSRPPESHPSRRVLQSNKLGTIAIYERERLWPGVAGNGPCIIEEYDSTTLIGTRWSWKVDEYGNIDMRRKTA